MRNRPRHSQSSCEDSHNNRAGANEPDVLDIVRSARRLYANAQTKPSPIDYNPYLSWRRTKRRRTLIGV
jgi:hypothetical protein